jgi:hypothetical protein
MMEYLEVVGAGLLSNLPGLVAWGIGVTAAVVLLRRGGGLAEKLFLAGVCLMFFTTLAGPFLQGLGTWLMHGASSFSVGARTYGLVLLPLSVFGLAGLVCLVWGFWLRFFRPRRQEAS